MIELAEHRVCLPKKKSLTNACRTMVHLANRTLTHRSVVIRPLTNTEYDAQSQIKQL